MIDFINRALDSIANFIGKCVDFIVWYIELIIFGIPEGIRTHFYMRRLIKDAKESK